MCMEYVKSFTQAGYFLINILTQKVAAKKFATKQRKLQNTGVCYIFFGESLLS